MVWKGRRRDQWALSLLNLVLGSQIIFEMSASPQPEEEYLPEEDLEEIANAAVTDEEAETASREASEESYDTEDDIKEDEEEEVDEVRGSFCCYWQPLVTVFLCPLL